MNGVATGVLGVAAAAAEVLAAAALLAWHGGAAVGVALLLHVTAALLAFAAALADAHRHRVDALLVGLVAGLIPGFGPIGAWWLVRRPAQQDPAVAAHLEAAGGPARQFQRASRADTSERAAISFRELLRHGSLDHRRNALRSLAGLGAPHHLALLRSCLSSDDTEIRLGAFAELDRLQRGVEADLAALAAAVDDAPADASAARAVALLALAAAHRAVGIGGLVDAESAKRQLRECRRHAEAAFALQPNAPAATTLALAMSELGEHGPAAALLRDLPAAGAREPQVLVAAATIAFRRRQFAEVVDLCQQLVARRLQPPAWLAAFAAHCRRPAPAGSP